MLLFIRIEHILSLTLILFCTITADAVKNFNYPFDFVNAFFIAYCMVKLNENTISKYIHRSNKYDIAQYKLSVKEYTDPFS